jgi:hypothetical protein
VVLNSVALTSPPTHSSYVHRRLQGMMVTVNFHGYPPASGLSAEPADRHCNENVATIYRRCRIPEMELGRNNPPLILVMEDALPQMCSHFCACRVVRLNIASVESKEKASTWRHQFQYVYVDYSVIVGCAFCAHDLHSSVWFYGSPVFGDPVS